VSGEVVLVAPADSLTARLVRSLDRLPSEGLDDFCVIGGLAVLCRVGALFRATSDIDTIVDDDAPAIAALRTRPGTQPTTNGVSIDGTVIDIIEIGPIDDPDALPDAPDDRLFLLAHRRAYDTATTITVEVIDPGTRLKVERAQVAMATRGALVAMKLQSYPRRRGPNIAKQGSDMQDLIALLADPSDDEEVGRSIASAPYGMGVLCADVARRQLIEDAEVAAGRLRRYTSGEIEPAAVRSIGKRLVAAIEMSPSDQQRG
jgi:hypothetical protein